MRMRIIDANLANAPSGERERIVKQQGVRKSRAIKIKIKQTSKKWRGSYETSLNFDFPPFSPLSYPHIHTHDSGHPAQSSPLAYQAYKLLMSPPSEAAMSNLRWYKWLSSQSPYCAKIKI